MLLVAQILLGVGLLAHDVVPGEEFGEVLQQLHYFITTFIRVAYQTEVVSDYLIQTPKTRQRRPLPAGILLEHSIRLAAIPSSLNSLRVVFLVRAVILEGRAGVRLVSEGVHPPILHRRRTALIHQRGPCWLRTYPLILVFAELGLY